MRLSKILHKYGSAAHALGDMYEDLRCLEVALHVTLRDALRRKFGDRENGWWRNGLSETLRKKLVERREEDDSPEDPYAYTDLLDLAEILEKHWGLIGAEIVPNASRSNEAERRHRRKSRARSPTVDTRSWTSPVRPRSPVNSFMVLQMPIFAEPIHHRGFGGAEFDPFRAVKLYLLVELFGEFESLLAYIVDPIELALKGELS